MKKLCFVACLLMAAASSFAQRNVGAITIQPKLGLNIASMSNAEGADARFALAAGAEFEYQATSMVALTAGALYSQQGIKGSESGIGGSTHESWGLRFSFSPIGDTLRPTERPQAPTRL